jgi:hypothetical protein
VIYAIAEQWGGNNGAKKINTNATNADSDYDMPFIRRYANE